MEFTKDIDGTITADFEKGEVARVIEHDAVCFTVTFSTEAVRRCSREDRTEMEKAIGRAVLDAASSPERWPVEVAGVMLDSRQDPMKFSPDDDAIAFGDTRVSIVAADETLHMYLVRTVKLLDRNGQPYEGWFSERMLETLDEYSQRVA